MKHSKAVLTFFCICLSFSSAAFAATTTLNPTDDAYVDNNDVTGNHGWRTYMIAGEWDAASPYRTCRMYLMFDISSIPPGQTITSADLYLNCTQVYSAPVQVEAHDLSDDTWDELTITWNNAPNNFAAAATDTTTISAGFNSWDITADVATAYTGDGICSIVMVVPNEGTTAKGGMFDTKEDSQTSDRPYLTITYEEGGSGGDLDYGDAPENAIAYPSLAVMGTFPTCKTVGPAGWVQHGLGWAHFEMIPPPGWDSEADGDAGLCPPPGCFPQYDVDECFMDGDAGLIIPDPYTIDAAGAVVTCPASAGTALGNTCTTAVWGTNVDIYVVNNMPVVGYVNVLMDWDQNGSWAGASSCPSGSVPEHVLVNFAVPVGYAGPLSAVVPGGPPPNFTIGPNAGYVWSRFMISEQQVAVGWDGSGSFEDGESEDYLLRIDSSFAGDIKWIQPPDTNSTGIDIRCDRHDGIMRTLADDFECNTPGPITDVHLWGSWNNDLKGKIQKIHLSIHDDIPDPDPQDPVTYSMPGPLRWEADFVGPNDFNETLYRDLDPNAEFWWDVYTQTLATPNADQRIWQYDILIDPNVAFQQEGDPCNPVVYWLDVWVELDGTDPNVQQGAEFGWKTSYKHWNDDGVYDDSGLWKELIYPINHPYEDQSIDMAFAITTLDCYTCTHPIDWVAVGRPYCWCSSYIPRQCHGDADGTAEGKLNYYVSTIDASVLVAAWNKDYPTIAGQSTGGVPWICADFNHQPEGKLNYRVSTQDAAILVANWQISGKPDPNCP